MEDRYASLIKQNFAGIVSRTGAWNTTGIRHQRYGNGGLWPIRANLSPYPLD